LRTTVETIEGRLKGEILRACHKIDRSKLTESSPELIAINKPGLLKQCDCLHQGRVEVDGPPSVEDLRDCVVRLGLEEG
jgi:hypothetical protein